MEAGGTIGHGESTLGINNLGHIIQDTTGANPQGSQPEHLIRTSGCFEGITQQVPSQEENSVSDSDDNLPEETEHISVNHPQRSGGKISKCTKV